MIWRFKNDREIVRTTITSKKMKQSGLANSVNSNSYERVGNRIIENVNGCKQISDIVSETPQTIALKTISASGNCHPAVLDATERFSKMPPTIYLKIKG